VLILHLDNVLDKSGDNRCLTVDKLPNPWIPWGLGEDKYHSDVE